MTIYNFNDIPVEKVKTIYSDGSAHPNPGTGGWAFVALDENNNLAYAAFDSKVYTTNNEMEMTAILMILKGFGKNKELVNVYSDSAYAIGVFTSWMYNWEKNGWVKSDKKSPENLEIVKEYFDLRSRGYAIHLDKIKGHDGIKGNELCDKLARGLISKKAAIVDFWLNS